jgi:hypothetical protein
MIRFHRGGKMSEIMSPKFDGKIVDRDAYVHEAYERAINYYRNARRTTKRSYKTYRFLSIFLGALLTLISSLAATQYVYGHEFWGPIFALATPIIAATLSVITGLSQSFQWGSSWRDMSVHAQKITTERDRFLATDPEKRDHAAELQILNGLLLAETESFFQRILDSQIGDQLPAAKYGEDAQKSKVM